MVDRASFAACFFCLAAGCDTPHTEVVLENASRSVIYRAQWHTLTFAEISPGTATDPQDAIPASPNYVYAVLAPDWNVGAGQPTKLIVLRSHTGVELHLDQTLHITVSDDTFDGDCRRGSFLSAEEAALITERIFPDVFAGATYDPTTCTTTP